MSGIGTSCGGRKESGHLRLGEGMGEFMRAGFPFGAKKGLWSCVLSWLHSAGNVVCVTKWYTVTW